MIGKLRGDIQHGLNRGFDPVVRSLARAGVGPNQVTLAGALVNVAAAVLVARGALVAAGVVWLLAGLLDLLDGALARRGGRATAFGAFLDSTVDRVSEGMVFAAIAYHFAAAGDAGGAAVTALALMASVLVSYTRARAEGLGLSCNVGMVTRAERVVLVAVGLCFGVLKPVVWILLLLSGVTVVQRVLHTRRQLAG